VSYLRLVFLTLVCSLFLAASAGATELRPPVVLLMGPPGVGKSTQARRIGDKHGLAVVDTGDLLRDEVARQTPLGKTVAAKMAHGDLVPDEVVDDLMARELARPELARGFVLDGYPRTLAQARRLDELLSARGFGSVTVLHLDAPDDVLVTRLLARKRVDDTRATIERRLALYRAAVMPIVEHYRATDYHFVDAAGSKDEVFSAVEDALPRRLRDEARR
jgi:adenylate kinase